MGCDHVTILLVKCSPTAKLQCLFHSALVFFPNAFNTLGLKGPPGASSNWIVRPYVHLSVIPSRFNKKCSLGDDTVTQLGL